MALSSSFIRAALFSILSLLASSGLSPASLPTPLLGQFSTRDFTQEAKSPFSPKKFSYHA